MYITVTVYHILLYILENSLYRLEKFVEKYLFMKIYLPTGCPGFEHDGSGDVHDEILICGGQFVK